MLAYWAPLASCRAGIAAAVQHDVVLVGHHRGELHRLRARQQHAGTDDRMLPDDQPFGVGELARLHQDLARDAGLAQVVQQAGHPEGPDRRPAQLEILPQGHREHRHVHRMGGGVLVELLELQERQHHGLLGVHRDRQRAHHRIRLDHGDLGAVLNLLVDPVHGVPLFAERVGQCRHRQEAGQPRPDGPPPRVTWPNRIGDSPICHRSMLDPERRPRRTAK